MVVRRPLVSASGLLSELPPGDTIVGSSVGILTAGSGLVGGGDLSSNQRVDVSLAPNPSGIIFVGDQLGLDGAAQRTADTALSSGNAGISTGLTALASGNAALARDLIASAVSLSGGVSGSVVYQSAPGVSSFLTPGISGQVLTTHGSGTPPAWETPGGGKILQVYQNTRATQYFTSSTSFVSTGLSITVTPASTSSRFLLMMSSTLFTANNGTEFGYLTFYRDSTNLGNTRGFTGTQTGGIGSVMVPAAISYLDAPSTTSSITYTVRLKGELGSIVYMGTDNRGDAVLSTFNVLEVES